MSLLARPTEERELLASAVEQAWCGAWSALGFDGMTQVEDTPHFLRVLTPGSPDLLLNAILRFHQDLPVERGDVEAAIAPFQAARRPLQWWLREETAPAGLREQLFALGMQPWGNPKGMGLRLANWQLPLPIPPEVVVRRVTTSDAAETSLRTICNVFGMAPQPMRRWGAENPCFTVFQATVRDVPAGALVRLQIGETVGFFHVATEPRFRRRGIATAMMAHALLDAQRRGARIAALTSSSMAETLYQRLGFVPCCAFELWMPTPRLFAAIGPTP